MHSKYEKILIEKLNSESSAVRDTGGFEDDPEYPAAPGSTSIPCSDFSHNPPTHICIPLGKRYRHICPSCGYTVILRPTTMWMGTNDLGTGL